MADSVAHAGQDPGMPGTTILGSLYVLFFCSGLAGLVCEVMWIRSFSLVFGSTTRAAAVVLASFFAGMAVGNLLGGRLARRRDSALLRYGLAELVIALGVLGVEVWLAVFQACYPGIYQSGFAGGSGMSVVKLVLAFVALAPPCMAMGATLPLMSQTVVATVGHVGRRVGSIYAINTIGATVGVLLAGFYLPVAIGTKNTVYLAAVLNVAVGLAALLLWARRGRAPHAGQEPANDRSVSPARRTDPYALFAAVVSGFGTLSLEVLYARMIMSETDYSVYSFAVMLATFLVFLAFGSLVVSAWLDRVRRPWLFLAWTQALAAGAIMVSPRVFLLLVMAPRDGPGGDSVGSHVLRMLANTTLVMGPAVLLIGTALPTAWKIASTRAGELGRRVGWLTGFNTLAAVAGSVAAGFVIVPWLGTGRGFVVIAAVYAILSMVAWTRVHNDHRRQNACVIVGLAMVLLYSTKLWVVLPMLPDPDLKIIRHHEGESATVLVLESPAGVRFLTVSGHYILGGSSPAAVALQKAQGRLPLTLHPQPDSVAFIGIATGISVSSVLEFPVKRVVAMELIAGVVDAAADFEAENGGILHDPRVETLVADGRNHLFGTGEQFDVIVGDLFIPWQAGTGYLYTTEHFGSVARRLKKGGIFAQWLPSYQLAVEELRMITATFTDVFPSATLWLYRLEGETAVAVLVGSAHPHAPGDPPDNGKRRGVAGAPDITYICDRDRLVKWAGSALRNSDEYPRIEFSAGASHLERGPEKAAEVTRGLLELRNKAGKP